MVRETSGKKGRNKQKRKEDGEERVRRDRGEEQKGEMGAERG